MSFVFISTVKDQLISMKKNSKLMANCFNPRKYDEGAPVSIVRDMPCLSLAVGTLPPRFIQTTSKVLCYYPNLDVNSKE